MSISVKEFLDRIDLTMAVHRAILNGKKTNAAFNARRPEGKVK
jgi:hypothetical protein